MKLLAFAALLAVTGCVHDEKLSDQPTQATAQIRGWVPVGTSLADAKHIMEQHHFTCSVMTNSNFGVVLTNSNFIFCNYEQANSWLVPTVYTIWTAALVVNNEKISDVHVNTGFKGL